jgi:anti-sigma B factor antagonist
VAAELRIETRTLADGRTSTAFAGEVDVTNVAAFRESLERVTPSGRVVAELTGLTYLDSAGIEVLFGVARRADLEIVARPDCVVRRLIDVVALDQVAALADHAPA